MPRWSHCTRERAGSGGGCCASVFSLNECSGSGSRRRRLDLVDGIDGGVHGHRTVRAIDCCAFARDVSWLTALVASFACGVEGSAVGRGAIS